MQSFDVAIDPGILRHRVADAGGRVARGDLPRLRRTRGGAVRCATAPRPEHPLARSLRLPRLPQVAAAALVLAACGAISAQTLAGRMGDKALLVLDGRTQVLAPGQAAAGVRVVGWDADALVIERDGQRLLLRPGGAQAVGAAASAPRGREVVIPVGSGGHFVVSGAINGRATRFMVDTGATSVALSRAEAERIGLDTAGAPAVLASTAGGVVPVQQVTLARLRLGEVELANVAAVVTPTPMPFVLLGNSALSRFRMQREADVMRLQLR